MDYNVISETLISSVQALTDSVYSQENIIFTATYMSEVCSSYKRMINEIVSIPEHEINIMLEGTEYTKDDVIEDIRQFKEDILETEILDESKDGCEIHIQQKINAYLSEHPALANIIYCIGIIITVLNGIQIKDEMILPCAQNAIVLLQGYENIFFIKVESAKLYEESSSRSKVVCKILYGEQVTIIESINMWNKVSYVDEEGNEFIGWVAKRNLMPYRDYEFNQDKLYE